MADLTHKIEVALGGTLTDLSTVVNGFNCGGGRQRQFETFQSGTCNFTIQDFEGDYIPGAGGLWSGETWIGREVKITLLSGGFSNVIWRGHVNSIDIELVDIHHARVTVTAVEPLARLGRAIIDTGTTFSSELSSVRLENVLALPEVDDGYFVAATKDITTGDTTLQAEPDASGNALQYLKLVEQSEGGRLFIRHGGGTGGVLAFRSRSGTSSDVGITFKDETAAGDFLVDGGTAATTTFDDTWDGGTAADSPAAALDGGDATTRFIVRPKDVDLEFSDDLVNRVEYARVGGTTQVAEDVGSRNRYGIWPASTTNLLNASDADVLDLAELRLARVSSPERNVESLSVLLNTLTDDQAAIVAGLTVGDQVRIDLPAPARVARLSGTVRIEQVRHDATPGRHLVTYRLTTLSDEFSGSVDGGTAATASFVDTWDGGDATIVTFGRALDGGTAIFG